MKVVKLIVTAVALLNVSTAFSANEGKAAYDNACAMCHNSGIAGAPKLTDKAGWKDRLAQGEAVLLEHSIKGFKGKTGNMPAKGGNPETKDEDVKSALHYMVEAVK
ncbi:MAG: c-type cytochrome [Gammaproteobacteria bacterium]|nr:c-type cytochrome [Gammaproteobacteria bacterium]